VILPVNETLLWQIGVLVWPYHSFVQRSATSKGKHTDIEGMTELETSCCQSCAVLHHILRLAPFLEAPNGYELGRDDNLQE
jgi:hypothetical protein